MTREVPKLKVSLEDYRNEARNNRILNIANRYKQNIHNAINRDGGKNIPIEKRLDMKFDKEVYTRAQRLAHKHKEYAKKEEN